MSKHFMGGYTPHSTKGAFRMWTQRVLPAVYDDSLSYYEVLAKLVKFLNDAIEALNTIGENTNNLYQAYTKLEEYVNGYFDNLDVTGEINSKLDAMAADGTLTALIKPLFDAYKLDINTVVQAQNQKISVLEGRMNAMTALPEGSTAGDAELQDVRVGYDGYVYASAGEAVRQQFGKIGDDMGIVLGKQLYNPLHDTDKYYYDESGVVTYGYGWHMTEDMPVTGGETIEYSGLTNTGNTAYSVFKDATGVIAVFRQQTGKNTLVVPENAVYVSFTLLATDAATFKVMTARDYVSQEELQEVKDSIAKVDAKLPLGITPKWESNKYILYTSGLEMVNELYSLSNFIDVEGYEKVTVTAKQAGSAGVCLYDGSKVYMRGAVLPYEPTEIDVSDARFIRVSCQTADLANARIDGDLFGAFMSKSKNSGAIGNYEQHSIEIDTSAFSDGYIGTYGHYIMENDAYKHSGFVPILGGQRITLHKISACAGFSVHFYNTAFERVGYAENNKTGYLLPNETVTSPLDAVYMRFNVRLDYASPADVTAEYTDNVRSGYLADEIIQRCYMASHQKIVNPYKRATSKLICTVVDDDTISTPDVLRFKAALDANGIKGTLSTLTVNFERDPDLLNTLLGMEREGFHVALHGYSQIAEYQYPDNGNNIKLCEENFVHGLQDMLRAGFANPRFWVTPYGSSTESLQNLARRWGMVATCATHNTYNTTDGSAGRHDLKRCAFNERDSDRTNPNETYTSSLAELKATALEASQNNGWLILMTHFANWSDADLPRFTEFVEYAKGLGFEFMTLPEAWDYRKPIYDLNDMF